MFRYRENLMEGICNLIRTAPCAEAGARTCEGIGRPIGKMEATEAATGKTSLPNVTA